MITTLAFFDDSYGHHTKEYAKFHMVKVSTLLQWILHLPFLAIKRRYFSWIGVELSAGYRLIKSVAKHKKQVLNINLNCIWNIPEWVIPKTSFGVLVCQSWNSLTNLNFFIFLPFSTVYQQKNLKLENIQHLPSIICITRSQANESTIGQKTKCPDCLNCYFWGL